MTEDIDKENHNKFWTGLVVGGLIGAVAAYFLSSEDKEKLRKEIAKKGKLLLGDLEDTGEKVVKKGEELKEKVVDEAQIISKKVEKLPKVAKGAVKDAQQIVEAAGENLNTTKKSLKKVFLKKGRPLAK